MAYGPRSSRAWKGAKPWLRRTPRRLLRGSPWKSLIPPILYHQARNLDGYADYLGRLSALAGAFRTTRNVGSRYQPIEPKTGGAGTLDGRGASFASVEP